MANLGKSFGKLPEDQIGRLGLMGSNRLGDVGFHFSKQQA